MLTRCWTRTGRTRCVRAPTRKEPGADEWIPQTLALLLPLLLLLTVLLLLLLLFLLFLLLKRRQRPIRLPLTDGPVSLSTDLSADPSLLTHLETTYLATVSPEIRSGYALAKDWQIQYSPNSFNTDITLNQFLTIQEKGVSAWSFEPDYEANPSLSVCSRTEITFLADGMGMTAAEGGGCSVMSNLPLPRLNEVVYWECKMYELPVDTVVAVGLATKPYPAFRLPGPSYQHSEHELTHSGQAGTSTRLATSPRTGSSLIRTPSPPPRTVPHSRWVTFSVSAIGPERASSSSLGTGKSSPTPLSASISTIYFQLLGQMERQRCMSTLDRRDLCLSRPT